MSKKEKKKNRIIYAIKKEIANRQKMKDRKKDLASAKKERVCERKKDS